MGLEEKKIGNRWSKPICSVFVVTCGAVASARKTCINLKSEFWFWDNEQIAFGHRGGANTCPTKRLKANFQDETNTGLKIRFGVNFKITSAKKIMGPN